MATSIEAADASLPRIDQGATWFVDLGWFADVDGVKTPVDLTGYTIRVRLMNGVDNVVLDIKNITVDDPKTGKFEIRLSNQQTQSIPFTPRLPVIRLAVRVDLVRTGENDIETGYKSGDVVALIAGHTMAYALGS